MRLHCCLTVLAFAILSLACSLPRAAAQGVNQFAGGRMEASGVVQAVDAQNLEVLVSDGNGGRVVLDFKQERVSQGTVITGLPNPQARVVGNVSPSVLSRGMMVRATGKVKDLEEFVEPVTSVAITGLAIEPNGSYGAFPEQILGITPEEQEAGVEGYVIAGQITRIRGNKIRITIPVGMGETAHVEAEISEDATVSLDVTDMRLVGPGDRVDFSGYTLDNQHVFVFTANFTKPDPETGIAQGGPAQEFHGPADAPRDRQAFGAGIPDVGQGPGAAPAGQPAAADPAADPEMQAGAGDAPDADPAEEAEVDAPAEPAEPTTPGRVLRIN